MEKSVERVSVFTEKGNLKNAASAQLREKAEAKYFGDFERTPKGELVVKLAEVEGRAIYGRVKLSISVADNIFDAPVAKADAEDLPEIDLFG